MRKISFAPAAVLTAGVAGALLRRAELSHAFEENGLPKPWAGQTLALAALSVAAAAVCAVLAVLTNRRFTAPNGFSRSFRTNSYLSFAAMAVAGVTVIGCAAAMLTRGDVLEMTGWQRWAFLLLMAFGGLGMSVMAYTSYTRKNSPLLKLGGLTLSIFFCFWMVALYRVNAGNPVILDYCYSALAFGTAAVSSYSIAGYAFGRKSLAGTVFFSSVSVYLLTVAAADPAPAPLRVAIAAAALFLTVNLTGLLSSLTPKEKENGNEP